MAQFVMIHDSAALPAPPADLDALADWVLANPGRFTFPSPPDFIGATFLKHVLHAGGGRSGALAAPPGDDAAALLAPVWTWLDLLQPHLWRGGEAFPASGPQLHQLFEDGEVDLTMAFNPAEASSLVLDGRFPETTRTYALADGSIGNTHFVAIPFNSDATGRSPGGRRLPPLARGAGAKAGPGSLGRRHRARPRSAGALPTVSCSLPSTCIPRPCRRTSSAGRCSSRTGQWMALIEDGWRQRYGAESHASARLVSRLANGAARRPGPGADAGRAARASSCRPSATCRRSASTSRGSVPSRGLWRCRAWCRRR